MGFALVLSIILKGIGAFFEIIIQILITRFFGVSGYGDYSFYISLVDISFWIFFSAIVKGNLFYLSDKKSSINNFKRKYFALYLFPIIVLLLILSILFDKPIYIILIFILLFQTLVQNSSSTLLSQGLYGRSLLGEYIIGRVSLILGLFMLLALNLMNIYSILIIYLVQYVVVFLYYILFRYKETISNKTEVNVSIYKIWQFQQSDIVTGLVSQSPVILQYLFIGSFEAGFVGIISIIRKLISFVSGPTAKVFLPEFSRLYKNNDYKQLRRSYNIVMKIQMFFINILFVFLICFNTVTLKIFSSDLLQFKNIFIATSIVFLFSSTLGPVTGLLQMTGKEAMDNKVRWYTIILSIAILFLLRKNRFFALIAITFQNFAEVTIKYGLSAKTLKKFPIKLSEYILLMIPSVLALLLTNILHIPQNLFYMIIVSILVTIMTSLILLKDKDLRDKAYEIIKKNIIDNNNR